MCLKVLDDDRSCEQVAWRIKSAWWDAVAFVVVKEDNVVLATSLEEIVRELFDEIGGM
jgi:hypothetical protein